MSNSNFDISEKYLRGELSPEEKTAFETALKTDSELVEDFAAVRTARNFAYLSLEKELGQKILHFDLSPPTLRKYRWKTLVWSGFLALAALFFWFLKTPPKKSETEPLETMPIVAHSADNDLARIAQNESLANSIRLLPKDTPLGKRGVRKQRSEFPFATSSDIYSIAQNVMKQGLEESVFQETLMSAGQGGIGLREGFDFLESEQWAEAQHFFEKLDSTNFLDSPPAQFGLGYAYFSLHDYGSADRVFKKINSPVTYCEKAFALMLVRLARFGPADSEFVAELKRLAGEENCEIQQQAKNLAERLNIPIE